MGPKQKPRSFDTKEKADPYFDLEGALPNLKQHNVTAVLMAELRECREEVLELEKGFRQELYVKLQTAFQIAESFNNNKAAWNAMCSDPLWQRCKSKRPQPTDDQQARIAWVVRYIFDVTSTEGPRYNRAYKYWRTLQGYARIQAPGKEVANLLARRGAEYAFFIEARDHPRQGSLGVEDVYSVSANDLSTSKGDARAKEPLATVSSEMKQQRGASQKATASAPKTMKSANVDEEMYLLIEVNNEQMAEAMTLAAGDCIWVQVKYVETSPPGWMRLVAKKLQL